VLTIALSIPERLEMFGSWEDDHACWKMRSAAMRNHPYLPGNAAKLCPKRLPAVSGRNRIIFI
jgi:hypothetical protein